MNISGLTIFYIVFGFFAFILIAFGIIIWILWSRRKLIFTNFLNDTGQWSRKSWKPDELDKEFTYDNETYKFDIKKCTRDKQNRPIAHYYKGNPEQQVFDYTKAHPSIDIGTYKITSGDFRVLMLSKVLKDIFTDEEMMKWLMIILFAIIIVGIGVSIVVFTHNPKCVLSVKDNETISAIAEGVRQVILKH